MIEYNACVDLLDRNVDDGRADHPAVVTRRRTVTYAELLDEVAATAAGLRRLGVAPEQRVAMVMLDSIEFYDVFLAAMRIGAVPAPVNPLLPGRDIGGDRRGKPAAPGAGRVGRAGRRGRRDPRRRARGVDRHRHRLARVGRTRRRGGTDGGGPWATWDESPGFWLCTSGSTGRPKLAMHRHIDLRVTADTYGAASARHSARTTAATRSGRCSTPTGWATRCRSRSRSAPRRSSSRPARRRRRSSARSPDRCSRRCCSASRRSTPRCVPPTCRPTRSPPCAGECRPPSRCRPRRSTASRSASACASSTASARRR